MRRQKGNIKALFYTGTPRTFRTTLIGHFYEISQAYPIVLLSEKLDTETEEALKNRIFFPKLEDIVPVRQFTEEKRNLLSKNIYLYKLAKNVIERYQPNIVISVTDRDSLFELYLMRYAKKINALKITIQPTNNQGADSVAIAKWIDLTNANLRFPSFLPFWLRLFLAKCRKSFGHLLYYWILPLMVGQKPFLGKSSYILRKGNSGMRDSDYQIVFSKEDRDIFLKDGVPAEKLYILSHPLARETKGFFEKVYFNKVKINKGDAKVINVLLPTNVKLGFRKGDFSVISREEREKEWVEILKIISQVLSGWEIYIKPHPDTKDFGALKETLESISEDIKITNPQEPADKYIEIADLIIGLPLSVSTVLFTASLQYPDKPIISLDFHQELWGDYYKDFEGIEYIDSEEKFIKTLELIRDDKYSKEKTKLKPGGFSNTIDLLEYLLKKKKFQYSPK